MRIHSLSRILSIPIALTILGILYLSYEMGYQDAMIWILVPLIAATAVIIFQGQIDFWWNERNPVRYQFLHTVETDIEDGVFILSIEHLIPGMINPEEHYNIAMHAYAEAYQRVYTKENFDYLDAITWEQLEEIGFHSQDKIMKTIGFNAADIPTIAINHFFTHPRRFSRVLPDAYSRLKRQFGADQLDHL